MSASMNTILVIGGTSGIGHSFVKRWHKQGKKVIITGRREDRLQQIKQELPGVESYAWDNSNLAALPAHIDTLFKTFPDIDTVWVNSGLQNTTSIKDLSTSSDQGIIDEITLNYTSPLIISRHVIPKFLEKKTPTHFMITSSGLGFVPAAPYAVYNGTKAAVHSYLVSIRQELQGTNVNVIEIVPPAVKTELGDGKLMNMPIALELEDFTTEIFEKLDNNDAKDLKEVAAGSAVPRVDAWRGSIGKILEERKLGG